VFVLWHIWTLDRALVVRESKITLVASFQVPPESGEFEIFLDFDLKLGSSDSDDQIRSGDTPITEWPGDWNNFYKSMKSSGRIPDTGFLSKLWLCLPKLRNHPVTSKIICFYSDDLILTSNLTSPTWHFTLGALIQLRYPIKPTPLPALSHLMPKTDSMPSQHSSNASGGHQFEYLYTELPPKWKCNPFADFVGLIQILCLRLLWLLHHIAIFRISFCHYWLDRIVPLGLGLGYLARDWGLYWKKTSLAGLFSVREIYTLADFKGKLEGFIVVWKLLAIERVIPG